jgi:hypothetical protein
MTTAVPPSKHSYCVFLHKKGEHVGYVTEDQFISEDWEEAAQFSESLAKEIAEAFSKNSSFDEFTVCIGRNLIQVDPFFPIVVIERT